ncbi:hypothetical protein N7478_010931 [Penicillium angulare]|uniref:uncharacterized protein n=1 Tax=Penicillium angulare TaxID=116970 RepID=UPI002541A13E|nr:uncharacterized protein N7478_010931 [Penicillium angulare]KAJ5263326.1 hypothetical protein N7478_010931 [Penicillium angulare]
MLLIEFLVSALAVVCHAGLLEERQHHGTSWSLYVYGGKINGLPVLYGDGLAKIGYASNSTATAGRNVYCKP